MGLFADLAVRISTNSAALEKGMKDSQKAVNKFGKNAQHQSKRVKGAFKSLGSQVGQLGGVIGSQFGMAGGVIGSMAGQIGGAARAIGILTKATKVWKVALASTGIGAIVIGLGTLITYLTSTQAGMDKVTAVTRPLSAIFQKLLGVVQTLGGSVFKGLAQIVKGDIVEGFKTMGSAISDAVSNTGDAVKDGAKAGTQLDKMQKQIERTENSLIKSRSKLRLEFEKQKKDAEDSTKSEQERIDAAQKAQKAQNQLLKEEQAFIDLKIKKQKLQNTLNDTSIEDDKVLAELIAERGDIEAEITGKIIEVRNKENALRDGINKKIQEQIDKTKELADIEERDNLGKEIKGLGVSITLNEEDAKDELQKSAEKVAGLIKPVNIPTKIQIDEAEAEAAVQDAQKKLVSSMKNVTDVVGHANAEISNAFAGLMSKQTAELENHYAREKELIQNSTMSAREKAKAMTALEEKTAQKRKGIQQKQAKADKASALMGAIVNVAQAVTKAMTAGPVIGQVLAGITAAMGAVQVATIASTPLPKFATGGIVQGSTTGDQNLIRANGGEMMLNKSQQSNMFDMINKGGVGGGTQNIRISGRLVGEGSSLVAVIDETTRRNSNNF